MRVCPAACMRRGELVVPCERVWLMERNEDAIHALRPAGQRLEPKARPYGWRHGPSTGLPAVRDPPLPRSKAKLCPACLGRARGAQAMYVSQAARLGHARCPGHQPRAWRWGLNLSSGCLCRRILGVACNLLAALFLELLALNQFMNEEELTRSRAAARGPNTPLTWAKAPR